MDQIKKSFFDELEKTSKKQKMEKLITNKKVGKAYKPRMPAGAGKNYVKNLIRRLLKAGIK